MSVVELPKLWTDSEVAQYLGVNPQTVARERRRKRLSYTLIGKKVRITTAQLEQYLRDRACTTTSSNEKTGSSTSAGPNAMGSRDAIRLASEILNERT